MGGLKYSREHLEAILPFASEGQAEYINYMLDNEIYSATKAAKELGRNRTTVWRALEEATKKAANSNIGPDYHHLGFGGEVAPGRHLGKQTVHVRVDEQTGAVVKNVWNRYELDKEVSKVALIKKAIDEAMADYTPLPPSLPTPHDVEYDDHVIPWYNIGDAHIGMLAHESEVGENFDIKKATRELSIGLTALIRNTEPATKCVINDFGDATHYENMAGVTEASGHMLDCDGRFVKMISAYVDVMVHAINTALEVHETVDVIINQGNHSRTNDLWMRKFLEVLYKDDPHVTIIDNTNVFVFYRMGNTLVLTHHSDKCKPDKLIDVLINDGRKDYGETEHHYIWIGHVHHHMTSKEFRGITIESFNTLASKDKYAHDNGYRSRQSITRVDLHKEYGEIGRATLNIQAVRAILKHNGVIK